MNGTEIFSLETLFRSVEFWKAFMAFAGAALGASFYVLLRAQPYLRNRSYDPKYNAAYISRFITGVIGGVILATAIGPQINVESLQKNGLSYGILAILGGYSAEAVELILQRLVEVLLALVRGDGSAQIQAKADVALANKTASTQEALAELEAVLGDPTKSKASIQKIRAMLKK